MHHRLPGSGLMPTRLSRTRSLRCSFVRQLSPHQSPRLPLLWWFRFGHERGRGVLLFSIRGRVKLSRNDNTLIFIQGTSRSVGKTRRGDPRPRNVRLADFGNIFAPVSRPQRLPHSRNWIPFHSSRFRPSWASSSRPGFHIHFSARSGVGRAAPSQPVIPLRVNDPCGRGPRAWLTRGFTVMTPFFHLGKLWTTPGDPRCTGESEPNACLLPGHDQGPRWPARSTKLAMPSEGSRERPMSLLHS